MFSDYAAKIRFIVEHTENKLSFCMVLKVKTSWNNAVDKCKEIMIGLESIALAKGAWGVEIGALRDSSAINVGCKYTHFALFCISIMKRIGQLISSYRDSNGYIKHYKGQSTEEMFFSLAPGLQEVDATKAGIGFCYNSQDNHIYEVTSNDDQDYHPACFGDWLN